MENVIVKVLSKNKIIIWMVNLSIIDILTITRGGKRRERVKSAGIILQVLSVCKFAFYTHACMPVHSSAITSAVCEMRDGIQSGAETDF